MNEPFHICGGAEGAKVPGGQAMDRDSNCSEKILNALKCQRPMRWWGTQPTLKNQAGWLAKGNCLTLNALGGGVKKLDS